MIPGLVTVRVSLGNLAIFDLDIAGECRNFDIFLLHVYVKNKSIQNMNEI